MYVCVFHLSLNKLRVGAVDKNLSKRRKIPTKRIVWKRNEQEVLKRIL
jgi:hypothetical protein